MAAPANTINFLKNHFRLAAGIFSGVISIICCISLLLNGLNLGIDFTGGTVIEISFSDPVPLTEVRSKLGEAGFTRAVVAHFGSDRDVLIRVPAGDSARIGEEIVAHLSQGYAGKVKLRRSEYVGPQVGDELRDQGGLALLVSFLLVGLYVAARFQWKLSFGAILALVHDTLFTVGAFSLFRWEFDLSVLAAVLALIGYSINDTIVVYDRVRENFRKLRKMDRMEVCNVSLTQTLGRTLMTSGVTLLSVIALLIFGGDALRGFSLALTIGIIFGTYSSIYVAINLALAMGLDRQDLMLPVQDGKQISDLP